MPILLAMAFAWWSSAVDRGVQRLESPIDCPDCKPSIRSTRPA